MDDYSSSHNAPWYSSRSSINKVVIADGVMSIGSYAFSYCQNLTSITIGNSVTLIGNRTFYNCSSLTSITIPDSVPSIGSYSFYNCSSLTSVIIGDGVTNIGNYSFSNCSSLTSISIPASVTSMGVAVFLRCQALNHINVSTESTNFTSEEGVLFTKTKRTVVCYPCGKTENKYTIPDGVAVIEPYAFSFCLSLTHIVIPSTIIIIKSYAFFSCSNLTDVTFTGTSLDWAIINIGSSNSDLLNASLHTDNSSLFKAVGIIVGASVAAVFLLIFCIVYWVVLIEKEGVTGLSVPLNPTEGREDMSVMNVTPPSIGPIEIPDGKIPTTLEESEESLIRPNIAEEEMTTTPSQSQPQSEESEECM